MKLWAYIVRRLLLAIPVLLGITIITFGISWEANEGNLARAYITPKMSPSQQQQVIIAHGFNQPIYVQYFGYLNGLLHLDFGLSHTQNDLPVTQVFLDFLPATLELTIAAMIFAIIFGIMLGTLSAVRKDTALDHITRFLALSGVSIPIFWLGLMLKIAFSTTTLPNIIEGFGLIGDALFLSVTILVLLGVGAFIADSLDATRTTWARLAIDVGIAAIVVGAMNYWLHWLFLAEVLAIILGVGFLGAAVIKLAKARHVNGIAWILIVVASLLLGLGLAASQGGSAVDHVFSQIPVMPLGGRLSDDILLASAQHPAQCPVFSDLPNCTGHTGLIVVDALVAGDWVLLNDALVHLILPGITLGYASMAIITRMTRSSMLEVLSQDFVRTARAKGLPDREVIRRHARPNALIPVTTVIGLSFGALLGGAVLTETIFQWPGLGRWSTNAITNSDTNSVMGFTLFVVVAYLFANLIVDILYSVLDPRVRLG
ncbi:MAG: ABC transporter permease [Thermoplasmatota archaeon]